MINVQPGRGGGSAGAQSPARPISKMARFQINKLRVDFDRDYGVDHKTGWSIAWDGRFLIQLEKHLIVAIIKVIFL